MTTDEVDRLLAACRFLGNHPEEIRLLQSEIASVTHYRSGTSQTYEVRFADGSGAAFKPIEGVEASAAGYGHTAASVILNDYAAWLVARGLGFDRLLGGTVLTTCPVPGVGIGSMQTWLDGNPSGPGWEQAAQLREAALFDALIGQQDRNGSNFNFEPTTDALGLFDQSFTFPLPGHQAGSSTFLAHLHAQGDAVLDQVLVDALDRFHGSPEQAALQEILVPDRWARVTARAQLMRQRGELLLAGEF